MRSRVYNNVGDFNMKHNNKYLFSLLLLPLLGGLSFLAPNKASKVEAYDKATVTTTINLSDVSDDTIRNYYSNLNSLSESERQGENLLKNLKGILKNGQKYYSYDSGNDIWKMYEIVDRDWKKSPASEIECYDASTKTITGYKYGTSVSNKGSNPYIHALYVNRNVENETTAWGDHTQKAWGINQEHIWAKAHGFHPEGGAGARGDLMHLWAGNGRVNGSYHNDEFFGIVDKNQSYTDAGNDYSYLSGNLRGKSKTLGSSYTVFEPQDSDKGDIARALFYMAARYNNFDGDTNIDQDNPNLRLVNTVYSGPSYVSSTTKTGDYGILSDLLEWNKLDPVDEFELHRNNLCFNNYTNNRNPFIDFPEWADLIWGADKNTKSANPTSDEIARPKDFVPSEGNFENDTNQKDGNLIPGIPNLYVYIAAGVIAGVLLVVVIVVLLKGNKKQKKTLKKVAKKVVKSNSKSKKK